MSFLDIDCKGMSFEDIDCELLLFKYVNGELWLALDIDCNCIDCGLHNELVVIVFVVRLLIVETKEDLVIWGFIEVMMLLGELGSLLCL